METTNKQPEFNSKSFICPHCHVFAEQKWKKIYAAEYDLIEQQDNFTPNILGEAVDQPQIFQNIHFAICNHCKNLTIWLNQKIIYPFFIITESANEYMPEKVRKIYEEAAIISEQSPRSAAALLRLALQILLQEIGGKGRKIDEDIAELLQSNRISHQVQKACDVLRVIGNNAVHPGQIDINDNPETVKPLFSLLNFIVYEAIQQKAEVNKLYNDLPNGALQAIERRNSKIIEKSDNQ